MPGTKDPPRLPAQVLGHIHTQNIYKRKEKQAGKEEERREGKLVKKRLIERSNLKDRIGRCGESTRKGERKARKRIEEIKRKEGTLPLMRGIFLKDSLYSHYCQKIQT